MDWNSIGTGAITGLGSALMSGVSSAINYGYQKKLMEYQNNWNLEMWNRQNEYNSPIQQMARYQEAGLNPNLIYSQGSAGNSQSIPSAAGSNFQMSDLGSSVSRGVEAAQQSSLISHQNEAYKAQANQSNTAAALNSNKALTEHVKYLTDLAKLPYVTEKEQNDIKIQIETLTGIMNDNALKLQEINYNTDTYDSRVQLITSCVDKNNAEAALFLADAFYKTEMGKQVAKNSESLRKLQNSQAFYYSELAKVQSSVKALNEQTQQKLFAETGILLKEWRNLDAKHKAERLNNYIKSVESAIGDMKGDFKDRLLTFVWRWAANDQIENLRDIFTNPGDLE